MVAMPGALPATGALADQGFAVADLRGGYGLSFDGAVDDPGCPGLHGLAAEEKRALRALP
jgi:hypothetical protein